MLIRGGDRVKGQTNYEYIDKINIDTFVIMCKIEKTLKSVNAIFVTLALLKGFIYYVTNNTQYLDMPITTEKSMKAEQITLSSCLTRI